MNPYSANSHTHNGLGLEEGEPGGHDSLNNVTGKAHESSPVERATRALKDYIDAFSGDWKRDSEDKAKDDSFSNFAYTNSQMPRSAPSLKEKARYRTGKGYITVVKANEPLDINFKSAGAAATMPTTATTTPGRSYNYGGYQESLYPLTANEFGRGDRSPAALASAVLLRDVDNDHEHHLVSTTTLNTAHTNYRDQAHAPGKDYITGADHDGLYTLDNTLISDEALRRVRRGEKLDGLNISGKPGASEDKEGGAKAKSTKKKGMGRVGNVLIFVTLILLLIGGIIATGILWPRKPTIEITGVNGTQAAQIVWDPQTSNYQVNFAFMVRSTMKNRNFYTFEPSKIGLRVAIPEGNLGSSTASPPRLELKKRETGSFSHQVSVTSKATSPDGPFMRALMLACAPSSFPLPYPNSQSLRGKPMEMEFTFTVESNKMGLAESTTTITQILNCPRQS
ncbi:hypothetical protein H4219_002420 [Mycoemilia scoparia]|uniref:Uncharacterized protein n=1 Tax=Mycoemilia scoparia TaxID=417184 RepID=A0A9W7ZXE8_9FUNG|nr:hypothetical protein H4219_002420 [Mycoemilia scoparia]